MRHQRDSLDAQPSAQPDRLLAAPAGAFRAARTGGRLPQTLTL